MEQCEIYSGRRPGAFRGPAWYPMVLLSICYLVSNIDRVMLSLLIEPIKATFKMTDTQVGFLQGAAFYIFWPLGALPLSRLADRGNRPKIIALCVLGWSAATSACGFVTSQMGLFWARAGVSMGESGLLPATFSFIPDIYQGRAIVRANAVFMSAVYIGGGLALIAGGTLYAHVQHWHWTGTPLAALAPWQLVFVIVGLPGLVLGPLVWLTLREPPDIARLRPAAPYGLLDVIRYMVSRRALQGPYVAVICANALLTATSVAWIPAMLARNFAMHEKEVGLLYGPIYMVAGLLGATFGVVFVGRASASDATRLRRVAVVLFVESLLLVVPSIVAPLATDLTVTLVLLAMSIFLFSGILVLATSLGQILFPSGMRAQASTLISLVNVLIGASLGPLLVGLVSDTLHAGARSLSTGIAIVTAIVAPLMVLSAYLLVRAVRCHPEIPLPSSTVVAITE